MKTKFIILAFSYAICACSVGYAVCTERNRDKVSDPCSHEHWIEESEEWVDVSSERCSECNWPLFNCMYRHYKITTKTGNLTEWKITYCEASCPEETKCLGMYVNIKESSVYQKRRWGCA